MSVEFEKLLLEKLGTNVRTRRKALKWTQRDLGGRASVHRTYVADVERGTRNVTLLTLWRIARALHATLSELCADVDLKGPTPSGGLAIKR